VECEESITWCEPLKIRYTFTLTPEVARKLEDHARANGLSRSSQLEIILREYFRLKVDISVVK
jgi:hypothetical protein